MEFRIHAALCSEKYGAYNDRIHFSKFKCTRDYNYMGCLTNHSIEYYNWFCFVLNFTLVSSLFFKQKSYCRWQQIWSDHGWFLEVSWWYLRRWGLNIINHSELRQELLKLRIEVCVLLGYFFFLPPLSNKTRSGWMQAALWSPDEQVNISSYLSRVNCKLKNAIVEYEIII